MERREQTLGRQVTFSGMGIHTGQKGLVVVSPAPSGTGRVFRVGETLIPALVENVVNTERCTVLGRDGLTVSTVEHLMAALYGLNVDNVYIDVTGPEIPILDGSAAPFVEEMLRATIVEQEGSVTSLELEEPVFVSSGDSLVLAVPDSHDSYEGCVSYPCPEVGVQRYRYNSYDNFAQGLAPARTFGFWAEVKALLERGLGRGGDLENALIFGRPAEMGAPKLRFANEPVRHKVLDLMGDIALLGQPLSAFVLAVKAGHRLHSEFVKKVRALK